MVLSTTNGATLAICVLVLVMVWWLDLYRKTVYRLALYQVLAALEVAAVLVAQIQFLNYDSESSFDRLMCVTTAYFFLQSQWTKLLLVVCVTIHLFCFAVFHRNLKRFELLYLLSSLLLPFIIAAIPLTTKTYGLAGSWCWIQNWNNDCPAADGRTGLIQQFVLWTVPSSLILLMMSVVMVVMVFIVAKRSCPHRGGSESNSITGRHQNRKALKQLLPLAAYPILFCVFNVLPFANRVFEAKDDDQMERVFEIGAALSNGGWGLTTALALVAHIAVVKCPRRGKVKESVAEYRYSALTARV